MHVLDCFQPEPKVDRIICRWPYCTTLMGDASRRLPWNLLSVIGKKRKLLFSDSALADCVIPQVQRAQAYGKVIAGPVCGST